MKPGMRQKLAQPPFKEHETERERVDDIKVTRTARAWATFESIQHFGMRVVVLVVATLFLATAPLTLATVDVRDLGLPNGWSATDYDNRGYDLLNKGDYASARKYFTAAIRVEPDRWTAYYNRASAFIKEKNWKG